LTHKVVRKVFVLGGARSGKSDFGMKEAESAGLARIYIATATALDTEMAERIKLHQSARGQGWETLEEPLKIAEALREASPEKAVLIDCLTLWLMNLISAGFADDEIIERTEEFCKALKECKGTVIAVSNEVGLGLVPESALSRRFRDLAGRVNQLVAEAATEVFLVAAGLPLKIK
jgi:adenosylcobinamide kinase/adenosylcobinamide-phosphate guanylyltransferase